MRTLKRRFYCLPALSCLWASILLNLHSVFGFSSVTISENISRKTTLANPLSKTISPDPLTKKRYHSTGLCSKLSDDEKNSRRISVLLCPAQFCVPADYESFFETLRVSHNSDSDVSIGTCRVAPLPRTEWIKVAKQLPTKAFLDAELSVPKTLDWYFDAIEAGLAEIFAEEGENASIALIGHSIGGWVARAYLGGLSRSSTAVYNLSKNRVKSLITLGTPHISPEKALVDQTRGLLREIAESPSCSSSSLSSRGIDITCVGSSSVKAKIFTTNIEEIVAVTSYFPLTGNLGGEGDGIVPLDLAFMESPARKIVIDESMCGNPVKHANVLPTPWNLLDGSAPSISLPDDFLWYGSKSVVGKWIDFLR